MVIDVLSNIVRFMVRGSDEGVVYRRFHPLDFHLPPSSVFESGCWPMLCAEIYEVSEEEVKVSVAAPDWADAESPTDFEVGPFWGEPGQESLAFRKFLHARIVPELGHMSFYVGLDTLVVCQVAPMRAKINPEPPVPQLYAVGKKTSGGDLRLDLRLAPSYFSLSDVFRAEPFLSAKWASGDSPQAYLYPDRVAGQRAAVIALALTKEQKRRLFLCYAADVKWLKPLIEDRLI